MVRCESAGAERADRPLRFSTLVGLASENASPERLMCRLCQIQRTRAENWGDRCLAGSLWRRICALVRGSIETARSSFLPCQLVEGHEALTVVSGVAWRCAIVLDPGGMPGRGATESV